MRRLNHLVSVSHLRKKAALSGLAALALTSLSAPTHAQYYYDTDGAVINSAVNASGGVYFGYQNYNAFSVGIQSGANISSDYVYAFNSATVNMSGGILRPYYNTGNTGSLFLRNTSIFNVNGTASLQNMMVNLSDTAKLNVSGGSLSATTSYSNTSVINAASGSTVSVTGSGSIGIVGNGSSGLLVSGGTATIGGGTISAANTATGVNGSGYKTAGVKASSGGQATVSAGTVAGEEAGIFIQDTASKVTVSGTAAISSSNGIGLQAAGGTVAVSGGTLTGATNALTLSGSTAATVSGGTLSNAAVSGVAILAGGTSTLTISGGTAQATGTNSFGLLTQDTAAVTWTGGSLTGTLCSAAVTGSSTLNVTGTTLVATNNGAYALYLADYNYSGNQYTLTGKLTSGATLNNKILASGVSGTATNTKFTAMQKAPDLYVTANADVTSINNDTYIGRNLAATQQVSPTVNIKAGADLRNVTTLNASKVTMSGGTIRKGLTAGGTSTVAITGGVIGKDGVTAKDSSIVTVSGGAIAGIATASTTAKLTVSGATLGSVVAKDAASVTLSSGTVNDVTASDTSLLTISGGTVSKGVAFGGKTALISGGTLLAGEKSSLTQTAGTVNITGGNIAGIYLGSDGDGRKLNVRGGTITGTSVAVVVNGKSSYSAVGDQVNIFNGTITGGNSALVSDTAKVNISGGTLKATNALGDAVSLYKTALDISGGTLTGGANGAGLRADLSNINISGGSITGGQYGVRSYGGSYNQINISGGTLTATNATGFGLYADRSTTVNWGGGKIVGSTYLLQDSSLNIAGTGLAISTGTATRFFDADGWNNYLGKTYTITGTLTGGQAINNKVFAGNTGGTTTAQSLYGVGTAQSLYLTTDTTLDSVYSHIDVGYATTTVTATSDLLDIYTANISRVTMAGGIVRGSQTIGGVGIEASEASTVNISGGTVTGGQKGTALVANNASTINITGGTFNGMGAAANDGAGINAYDASIVNINGANTLITGPHGLNAYNSTIINFAGGKLTGGLYAYDDATVNFTGGKINEVFKYDNAVININGGTIGPNTLYSLRQGLSDRGFYNLFGTNFALGTGIAGEYEGETGYYFGLTGTLANGDILATRYFEAGASINGPEYLRFFGAPPVAAPEPGSIALLLTGLFPIIGIARRVVRRA